MGQGRVEVGVVIDLILLGHAQPQGRFRLANRQPDPARTLKTPQMAQTDRSHADDQHTLEFRHSRILAWHGTGLERQKL